MFAGKPIIGIVGGIGSGKSRVASLFGELGCLVIDADTLVRAVYTLPHVKETLRQWWGDSLIDSAGNVDRKAIADRVFTDPAERKRLEELLHPIVVEMRDRQMQAHANDPQTVAFLWDVPLLLETGQNRLCDAVVFVDAPAEVRLQRVRESRGWDADELLRRENLQWPLYRKREISDDVITNIADADSEVRNQVRLVLSRILARTLQGSSLQ